MSHRSHKDKERGEREETGRLVRARAALEVGEAATYLETLAQALRAGGVTIRRGHEVAALRVGERAELKLEAGEEGAQSLLRLELRWETPQPEERLEITPGVESASGGQGAQASQGGASQGGASQGGPSGSGGQPGPGRQGGQGRQGSPGRQGGQAPGEQASGPEGT